MTIRSLRRGATGVPAAARAIHDPPPRLWLRGERRPTLLARPAVAIVGARACSAYGRSVARIAGARARGGRRRRGQRAGARDRRRGASRRARGRRDDGRGARLRHRPRLPGGARRARAADRASGGLVVSEYEPGVEPAPWRFPARNRIIAGLCPRDGRRRGARAARRAHHRRLRARGGAGGAGGAGRDHVGAVSAGRTRCSGSVRRRDLRRRTCSRRSGSSRAGRSPRSGRSRLGAGARRARERARARRTSSSRATGLGAGRARGGARELELAGAITVDDGVCAKLRSPDDPVLARRACARAAAVGNATGTVDVEIVGGGITGCSCALALAEAGLRVRLVRGARDRRGCERPKRRVRAPRNGRAVRRWSSHRSGDERALALWQWTEAELRAIGRAGGRRVPARSAACASPRTTRSARSCATSYEALRADGFEAEWLDDARRPARRPVHRRDPPSDGRRAPAGAPRAAARGPRRARPGRRSSRSRRVDSARRAGRRDGGRRDRRLPERPARRARGPDRPDARPGDRHRAAGRAPLRAAALRPTRIRLLAPDARTDGSSRAASATSRSTASSPPRRS